MHSRQDKQRKPSRNATTTPPSTPTNTEGTLRRLGGGAPSPSGVIHRIDNTPLPYNTKTAAPGTQNIEGAC